MRRDRTKKRIAICLTLTALLCGAGCRKKPAAKPEDGSSSRPASHSSVSSRTESETVSSRKEETTTSSAVSSQPVVSSKPVVSSSPAVSSQATTSAVTSTGSSQQEATSSSEAPVSSAPVALPEIKSQAVVSTVAEEIGKLLPELDRSEGLSDGKSTTILVDASTPEEEIADQIHDALLDLFQYDLYLEHQNDPSQGQPVVLDYTYDIVYKGLSADGKKHQFAVIYAVNQQAYVDDVFDSDAVIRQVTAGVLASEKISVTAFEGDSYTDVLVIDSIPFFFTTEECTEWMVDKIEDKIYSENVGQVKYTGFRVVFHSKSEANYTFLVYLK